jgi:hypothetical protein
MPTLTYPSATFPGRPALRLDVPEGWEAVPAGTVGGEAYAGVGAHANVDANFSAESVKVDVGAAIGIGGGVSFSVDVNPKEFIEDVGLDDVADGLGSAIKDPIGTIGGFFP